MTAWTEDELSRVGQADELLISSTRPDGTLSRYVIIWAVRAVDELYVRSAHGPTNGWFAKAVAAGTGRIKAGGVERDVSFGEPDPAVQAAIDAEYHRKYDQYGAAIVDPVVGPDTYHVTLRLDPRDS